MTGNDDFIGLLEDYLDSFDGATPLPERVRDAIDADLPRTRQVRPRPGPWKVFTMLSNTPAVARWGLAAAIVVAVGLGAAALTTNRDGGEGGPATPTPNPTPIPSPTVAPIALQAAPYVPCDPGTVAVTCIQPGTYSLGASMPRDVQVTVPAGWFEWDPGPGSVGLLVNRPDGPEGSGWGFLVMQIGDVARDPCDPAAGIYPPSEVDTPGDLASAMAAWPGFSATAPQAIAIDGVEGQLIRITSTRTSSECPAQSIWRTASGTTIDAYPMVTALDQPYPADFRIIELDGRLVAIRSMASARTSPNESAGGLPDDPERHADDLVALQGILDSIQIEEADPSTAPTD